jgi:hypothetical protein
VAKKAGVQTTVTPAILSVVFPRRNIYFQKNLGTTLWATFTDVYAGWAVGFLERVEDRPRDNPEAIMHALGFNLAAVDKLAHPLHGQAEFVGGL